MSRNGGTITTVSSYHLIAALGSSFAAGPGIAPIEDPAAMRSARNYAHQLAERLGAEPGRPHRLGRHDGECHRHPAAEPRRGPPTAADRRRSRQTPTSITVTAGGNDLQFAGAMLYFAWQRHRTRVADGADARARCSPTEFPHPRRTPSRPLPRGSWGSSRRAREKAPDARVLLVDYLTVLDDESLERTPFTKDELDQFLVIQTAIGTVFAMRPPGPVPI